LESDKIELVKSQSEQKEQSKGHNVADEEFNDDLILKSWRGVKDQVKRVIEWNREQGIPNPESYIGYHYADGTPEPMSIKQKIRFLKSIKHAKGSYITVDSLVASGKISDLEKEAFGQQRYPRLQCSSMFRIKTQQGQQYLTRVMRALGLSEIGAIVSIGINGECDFTRKVPTAPTTAKLPDGTDAKALYVGSGEFTYETSPKIYTTPFTEANVRATLEKYPLPEDEHTEVTYIFQKEGIANPVQVSGLQEFLGDFDSTFERLRQPAPTIQIDSKGLAAFAKMDSQSRADHKQYS
jgi:hypothetical protein